MKAATVDVAFQMEDLEDLAPARTVQGHAEIRQTIKQIGQRIRVQAISVGVFIQAIEPRFDGVVASLAGYVDFLDNSEVLTADSACVQAITKSSTLRALRCCSF